MEISSCVADRNHWKGIYWLVKMDMPIPIIDDFKEELKRDVDVIKIFAARLANEETIVHVRYFSNCLI
jgi:ribosomal protein S6